MNLTPLTSSEQAVLQLVWDGYRHKEIAGKLQLSMAATNGRARSIRRKLGATTMVQAVRRALWLGLLHVNP